MPSKPALDFVFGDVVLVPFPFTSQTAAKKRPAVVVSSRAYAAERPDVVLMAITSQMRPSPVFAEVWLRDWQIAGLLKPSAVKPILATFEKRLVVHQLGTLSADDQNALTLGIAQIVGAARSMSPQQGEADVDRIDDAVLALLLLGLHEDSRVWKSFDWDAMDRLYNKGFISDPKSKSKSVALTENGQNRATHLFNELFGRR